MNNKYLYKQKGIILPVVLIFFSFLMLLGVTYISIGGFQLNQSVRQANSSQAYYLAKSGAHTFAEYLVNTSKVLPEEEVIELLDNFTDKSFDFTVENGIVEINTTRTDDHLIISSKGIYDNLSDTIEVRLLIIEGSVKILPTDPIAIKTAYLIERPQSYLDDLVDANVISTGSVGLGSKENFQYIWYNQDISKAKEINQNNLAETKEKMAYIPQVVLSGTTEINMHQGSRLIVVDNLIMNNNSMVKLKNNNTDSNLIIYVKNKLIMNNNSIMFNLADMKHIKIYAEGQVEITNNAHFYGAIFLKNSVNSKVSMEQNASLTGLIYGTINELIIKNNANITGAIVLHTISYSNNSAITTEKIDMNLNVYFNVDDNLSEEFVEEKVDETEIIYDKNPWN